MTSPRIQEIRRALNVRATLRTHYEGCELSPSHADCAIRLLLDAWDTRSTALRSLVQQWREKAEWEMHLISGVETGESEQCRQAFKACADQLAALLED